MKDFLSDLMSEKHHVNLLICVFFPFVGVFQGGEVLALSGSEVRPLCIRRQTGEHRR